MKKIHKKILFLLIVITLMASSLAGCSNTQSTKNDAPIEETKFLLGTICSIKIYDKKDKKILEDAFNRVQDIENKMSANIDSSEISKIASEAGKNEVVVSEDTFKVLKEGEELGNISNGNFDITIGPLVKLWGIGTDHAKVPSEEELKNTLPLIDHNKLILNETNKSAKLSTEGMTIDLGAIAKGYAADEVREVLRKNGVEHAIINLGGNVLTVGGNMENENWNIGVQDPLEERGDALGVLSLKDSSIVTSGIYERYLEADGKRYHHILNPKTGYPYDNDVAGVTVVTKDSLLGDALSTTLFSMGVDEGLKFVNDRDDVEAIFVTKDKKIYFSNNMKDKFTLKNNNYTIMN